MTLGQQAIDSLKLARLLPIGRDEAWNLIVDSQRREHWWPHTTIDFSPGDSIRCTTRPDADRVDTEAKAPASDQPVLSGEVDVVMTGHALGFSWRRSEDPWATTALMTLSSLSSNTQVSVVELGFMGFPNETERMRAAFAAWDERLSALEAFVRASVTSTAQ